MDPVTHLLVSYTLARAARARITSPEMAVFVLAGLAPSLDWLWHLPAPLSPLRAYGTATQSLAGAAVLACVIAAGVWVAARKRQSAPPLPRLLAAAFIAAGARLLLDLSSTPGIELDWPFRATRVSWELVDGFDAILLVILAACALLSALPGLVAEEIGARRDPRPPRAWPVAALALILLYLGARAILHHRVEESLGSAQYKGSPARRWAAFPAGSNPFSWRGVVETDLFLAEVEVPVGPGADFSPDKAALHYKPEPSPEEESAAAAPLARAYTALARFPLLVLTRTAEGSRADLHELGESVLRSRRGAWHAVIDLDAQSKIVRQELLYEATRAP